MFGILNMLVSVASFLPIIIVGPVADLFGNATVLFVVAIAILISGIFSIIRRGRLKPEEAKETSTGPKKPAGLDPVAVSLQADLEVGHRRTGSRPSWPRPAGRGAGGRGDVRACRCADETAVAAATAPTPADEPGDDDPVINPS